jgi:hypothetical protein
LLWYFVEVANPTDPAKVILEPRLRRGGEPLAGLPPFPAILPTLGPKRYLAGVELPLSTLGPEYVLYLGVRDGEAADRPRVLRTADSQVVRPIPIHFVAHLLRFAVAKRRERMRRRPRFKGIGLFRVLALSAGIAYRLTALMRF